MGIFFSEIALSIATVPAVDLNQFPTDLTPQELTEQVSVTGNSYSNFNGMEASPFN